MQVFFSIFFLLRYFNFKIYKKKWFSICLGEIGDLGWNSEHVWEALTPKRYANPQPGLARETNYVIQSQLQWQPEYSLELAHVQNSAPESFWDLVVRNVILHIKTTHPWIGRFSWGFIKWWPKCIHSFPTHHKIKPEFRNGFICLTVGKCCIT